MKSQLRSCRFPVPWAVNSPLISNYRGETHTRNAFSSLIHSKRSVNAPALARCFPHSFDPAFLNLQARRLIQVHGRRLNANVSCCCKAALESASQTCLTHGGVPEGSSLPPTARAERKLLARRRFRARAASSLLSLSCLLERENKLLPVKSKGQQPSKGRGGPRPAGVASA